MGIYLRVIGVVKLLELGLFEKDEMVRSCTEDGTAMGSAAKMRARSWDITTMRNSVKTFIRNDVIESRPAKGMKR